MVGTRATFTDREYPFSAALTVAVWAAVSTAVVTENVAEVAFRGMLTAAGTLSGPADDDSATVTPVPLAALVKPTVHVVFELESKLLAAHCSVEISGGAVKFIDAVCEEPFSEAVIVAI